MRPILAILVLLAVGGLWYVRSRPAGPPPVWVELGSLLRYPPGRETLYQYGSEGRCYTGGGRFLAIRRFSSYNRQLGVGAALDRLTLYLRNDAGAVLALVVRDAEGRVLAVNLDRPGFSSRDGRRWDEGGRAVGHRGPDLLRLPTSVADAQLRVDARAVTCPENLPERRGGP